MYDTGVMFVMKKYLKGAIAAVLVLTLAFIAVFPAFTVSPFLGDAYASVVTVSDLQDSGSAAFTRFGNVLSLMKGDGLPTPGSVLVGGDFTKLLFDDAIPGVTLTRKNLTDVYPDADPDTVVCIQGNHDNPVSGLTKTGFYDMGAYCLYAVTEDDFPWLQGTRSCAEGDIKALAEDMTARFNAMIDADDLRPVIIMTHLPLHHTYRASWADNKYASYVFNAINNAAETLDMIFLFGHQHSGDYDDYIGGSVNYMQPGDLIRVPLPDRAGENCYTEETLNFTYLNCGYLGYSNNHETETSTNVLTLGAIQFSPDTIRFVKYSQDGFYRSDDVTRKNTATEEQMQAVIGEYPEMRNRSAWEIESGIFTWVYNLFTKILDVIVFWK